MYQAAALLLNEPEQYKARVKDYVQRYATSDAISEAEQSKADEDDSDMSSIGSMSEDEDDAEGMEL